jgi:hypothetical protein
MPPHFNSDESEPNPTSAAVTLSPIIPTANLTPLKITAAELRKSLGALHLANDGDGNERAYWPAINEHFPNYERFWRDLVVPMTKRIEVPLDSPGRHERRDRIADDVWRISYINYSIFLYLAHAFDHLSLPVSSSFGDFYPHLGSACDLLEDFLVMVYMCVSECRGQPVPALQGWSKEEFLEKAARWYEEEYPKAYEHYHKKGKAKGLYLPPRAELLGNYLGPQESAWAEYKKLSNAIREYRNKVVHDVAIGHIIVGKISLCLEKRAFKSTRFLRQSNKPPTM